MPVTYLTLRTSSTLLELSKMSNPIFKQPQALLITQYINLHTPFIKRTLRSQKILITRLANKLQLISKSFYSKEKLFYCYAYLDPRYPATYKKEYSYRLPSGKLVTFSHKPFYIGKGSTNRILGHIKEANNSKANNFKLNTIRSILALNLQPILIQTKTLAIESKAFAFEIDLIAGIGRFNLKTGPLTNNTDGGEGTSGVKWSEESKNKASKSRLGTKQSEETINKQRNKTFSVKTRKLISESLKEWNRKNPITSPESSAIRSLAQKGRIYDMSPEACAKRSLIHVNRPPISNETRERMRKAQLGKKQSPELVAKRVLAITGQKRTLEQCERMSKAMKGIPKGKQTPQVIAHRTALITGKTRSVEQRNNMSIGKQKAKAYKLSIQ